MCLFIAPLWYQNWLRLTSWFLLLCLWMKHWSVAVKWKLLKITFLLVAAFSMFHTIRKGKILKSDNSKESYWEVLSCDAVCYAVHGGWVCGWNPEVWQFKLKLLHELYFPNNWRCGWNPIKSVGLHLPFVSINKRGVWTPPRTLAPKAPQNQSLDPRVAECSAHNRFKAIRSFNRVFLEDVNFRQPYWNSDFTQNIKTILFQEEKCIGK